MPTSPLIFSKPPSSLLAPMGQIRRPAISERVDHEGELEVVVMGVPAGTCARTRTFATTFSATRASMM